MHVHCSPAVKPPHSNQQLLHARLSSGIENVTGENKIEKMQDSQVCYKPRGQKLFISLVYALMDRYAPRMGLQQDQGVLNHVAKLLSDDNFTIVWVQLVKYMKIHLLQIHREISHPPKETGFFSFERKYIIVPIKLESFDGVTIHSIKGTKQPQGISVHSKYQQKVSALLQILI